ncbi:MAG: hypothetical protein Q9168_008358, partial [Polycauliona sp. 1 TL-2023]
MSDTSGPPSEIDSDDFDDFSEPEFNDSTAATILASNEEPLLSKLLRKRKNSNNHDDTPAYKLRSSPNARHPYDGIKLADYLDNYQPDSSDESDL